MALLLRYEENFSFFLERSQGRGGGSFWLMLISKKTKGGVTRMVGFLPRRCIGLGISPG
jgi:hypothetical protein